MAPWPLRSIYLWLSLQAVPRDMSCTGTRDKSSAGRLIVEEQLRLILIGMIPDACTRSRLQRRNVGRSF